METESTPDVGSARWLTKTEAAAEALRAAVLRGEIKPGEKVLAAKIARELGMSATPVREAIRTMQAEGLLTSEPHRPGMVAELSPEDARELYMLRAMLEGKATSLAVRNLDQAGLARLKSLHDELRKAESATVPGSEFARINADWHFAIYSASESRLLSEFIVRLWARVPWNQMYRIPGRSDVSVREHQAILDAATAGDHVLAERLMSEHIMSGMSSLRDVLREEE